MTTSTSFSFHRGVTSTIPLLLLAFLSLSPAWAGAFNSGITSLTRRHHIDVDGSSAFLMKTSPSIARGSNPASPSSLSLSRMLLIRGGDEDTVTSDETASLDSSINTQRQYGTHTQQRQDEEEAGASGASVEMTESQPAAVEVESAADESMTKRSVLSPLLSAMAPLSSLLKASAAFYTQQLTLRPILTKSLTAGIIFGLSDWCAQLVEEREESDGDKTAIVFSRILAAFLVGLLFFGPAANAWYAMVFKILPSTSLVSTLQKAALGQIIFGPTFTCVFFGAGMIQSGTFSLGAWLSKIRTDLPGVWASGLGYWPAVDFISFKIVPVKWIPLFVNFCSFIWTIYLSLVANKGKGAEE